MSTRLSPCCLSGHQHEGTPTGSFEQYAGFKSYIANPEAKEHTIIALTDIFGIQLKNIQLLADEYAKTGDFRVIVPDVFCDDSVPIENMKTLTPLHSHPKRDEEELKAAQGAIFGSTVGPWLERQKDDNIRPRINAVVAAAAKEGKVGVLGFCFGARQALLLAGENEHIAAAVANHPSFAEYPQVFEAVKVPTLIQVGTEDGFFPFDQVKGVRDEIFSGKKDAKLITYDKAVHGFACRGDINNKEERDLQDQATVKSIDHLRAHM